MIVSAIVIMGKTRLELIRAIPERVVVRANPTNVNKIQNEIKTKCVDATVTQQVNGRPPEAHLEELSEQM